MTSSFKRKLQTATACLIAATSIFSFAACGKINKADVNDNKLPDKNSEEVENFGYRPFIGDAEIDNNVPSHVYPGRMLNYAINKTVNSKGYKAHINHEFTYKTQNTSVSQMITGIVYKNNATGSTNNNANSFDVLNSYNYPVFQFSPDSSTCIATYDDASHTCVIKVIMDNNEADPNFAQLISLPNFCIDYLSDREYSCQLSFTIDALYGYITEIEGETMVHGKFKTEPYSELTVSDKYTQKFTQLNKNFENTTPAIEQE